MLVAVGRGGQPQLQLRAELQLLAAVELDRRGDFGGGEGRRVGRVRPTPQQVPRGRVFGAVGAVEGEFLAVDVDEDRADIQLGATEDIRNFDVGIDLRRFRVDLERHPDDDGAEVERPGDRGGDHGQRDGRAFVRAGEEDVAADLQGRAAGPGLDRGDADVAVAGAARVFLLRRAGPGGGVGDVPGRAVRNAGQFRRRPRGQVDVD